MNAQNRKDGVGQPPWQEDHPRCMLIARLDAWGMQRPCMQPPPRPPPIEWQAGPIDGIQMQEQAIEKAKPD